MKARNFSAMLNGRLFSLVNREYGNPFLFLLPAIIWGSTWYVIKFQLGDVDPMVSVIYRFAISSGILFLYARKKKYRLKYGLRSHLLMALQGATLFGINYWMTYWSENYLTSGLVAVLFSMMIFTNIFISALILHTPVKAKAIMGAFLGVFGTMLVFYRELILLNQGNENTIAVIVVLCAVILASLGNVMSGVTQRQKISVIPGNAYSMMYGTLSLIIVALILGKEFTFSFSFAYIGSLLYLAIFGSVVAFGAYLTLLGRIGPHKAGYITLLVPVFAMMMSTIFEDYQWTMAALIGIAFILAGNYIVLNSGKEKYA